MSVKKRKIDDPGDTGKLDVYDDLQERLFQDLSPSDSQDKPGRSIIHAAIVSRDTALLRTIAAERKGLTDEQRRALLLLADLLARATHL
jgi:hypothetical protein